jgi:hypothetical protein
MSGNLGWEAVPLILSYLLVLPTVLSTGVHAFHGNATEDALLEIPGAASTSTGLACEKGTAN